MSKIKEIHHNFVNGSLLLEYRTLGILLCNNPCPSFKDLFHIIDFPFFQFDRTTPPGVD